MKALIVEVVAVTAVAHEDPSNSLLCMVVESTVLIASIFPPVSGTIFTAP
jgi:hypothetical protein